MAEILGLGVTHWPTLCSPNEGLTGVFKTTLRAPNVEAARKDPASWPAELIAELGNDDGLSAANRCGERFGNDFRAIRKILDDFNPDLVLVWGDDQYENFREDIVPPVCRQRLRSDIALRQGRPRPPVPAAETSGPSRGPAVAGTLALHASWCCGCRGAGRLALSGGADRLVELVSCISVAEKRLFVAGP